MPGQIFEMKPQAATEVVGYHRDLMQVDVKTLLMKKVLQTGWGSPHAGGW